jgi:hypothetical protein
MITTGRSQALATVNRSSHSRVLTIHNGLSHKEPKTSELLDRGCARQAVESSIVRLRQYSFMGKLRMLAAAKPSVASARNGSKAVVDVAPSRMRAS